MSETDGEEHMWFLKHDNRPVFNCYKDGHDGPYIPGGPRYKGVLCLKCYELHRQELGLLDAFNPLTDTSVGYNRR